MRLNEKLGVPEGIIKQGKIIYNDLIKILPKKIYVPHKDYFRNGQYMIKLSEYNINFKDLNLKSFPFKIIFNYYDDLDSPLVLSLGFSSYVEHDVENDDIITKSDLEKSFLLISVAVNEKFTKKDVIEAIKKELKPELISHELMHLYDKYKRGPSSIEEDHAEYLGVQFGGFPKIVNKFLHLLYFVSNDENLVRPTQLYHMIEKDQISKDEFKEFVEKTNIMEMINKAKSFSIEDYKKDLNNDPDIKDFVENAIKDGYQSIGNLADDMLNLVMINIVNITLNHVEDSLRKFMFSKVPIVDQLFGSDEKYKKIAEKKFNQILRKYKKYEEKPHKFFAYLEKNLNFVGDKMKRKLFKLYDMAKNKNKETKSVIDSNWDLHQKITSKNEKIKYTLDFEAFKKNFKNN